MIAKWTHDFLIRMWDKVAPKIFSLAGWQRTWWQTSKSLAGWKNLDRFFCRSLKSNYTIIQFKGKFKRWSPSMTWVTMKQDGWSLFRFTSMMIVLAKCIKPNDTGLLREPELHFLLCPTTWQWSDPRLHPQHARPLQDQTQRWQPSAIP